MIEKIVNDKDMLNNAIVAIGYDENEKDLVLYINPKTWLGSKVRTLSAESRGKFLCAIENISTLYLLKDGKN
jgi:hypothetical protein